MDTINVTFSFGLSRTFSLELNSGTTLSSAISRQDVKAALALPESVSAVKNGDTLTGAYVLQDGDEIIFEKQAAAKA